MPKLEDLLIEGVSPLVETPPPPITPEEDLKAILFWNSKRHLDLQEICITFKPKYHNLNSTYLHNILIKHIKKYLQKYNYFKPVIYLVPEFNNSGILHYHGIVYFDNSNDYWVADLKRRLNAKFGRTTGKSIHNLDNYLKYIQKDLHKQKFTINSYFINYLEEPSEAGLIKIGTPTNEQSD